MKYFKSRILFKTFVHFHLNIGVLNTDNKNMYNHDDLKPKEETIMTINKQQNGNVLTLAPQGRLDTVTSPELEAELKNSLDGVESLILDLSGLEYISSAGLRVLLSAHKTMSVRSGMKVTNAGEIVREVFEVTGFSDILNIE